MYQMGDPEPIKRNIIINEQKPQDGKAKRKHTDEYKIGTYNVRTLLNNRICDLALVCAENNINILAIQEHRWTTEEEGAINRTEDMKWAIEGQGVLV